MMKCLLRELAVSREEPTTNGAQYLLVGGAEESLCA